MYQSVEVAWQLWWFLYFRTQLLNIVFSNYHDMHDIMYCDILSCLCHGGLAGRMCSLSLACWLGWRLFTTCSFRSEGWWRVVANVLLRCCFESWNMNYDYDYDYDLENGGNVLCEVLESHFYLYGSWWVIPILQVINLKDKTWPITELESHTFHIPQVLAPVILVITFYCFLGCCGLCWDDLCKCEATECFERRGLTVLNIFQLLVGEGPFWFWTIYLIFVFTQVRLIPNWPLLNLIIPGLPMGLRIRSWANVLYTNHLHGAELLSQPLSSLLPRWETSHLQPNKSGWFSQLC